MFNGVSFFGPKFRSRRSALATDKVAASAPFLAETSVAKSALCAAAEFPASRVAKTVSPDTYLRAELVPSEESRCASITGGGTRVGRDAESENESGINEFPAFASDAFRSLCARCRAREVSAGPALSSNPPLRKAPSSNALRVGDSDGHRFPRSSTHASPTAHVASGET